MNNKNSNEIIGPLLCEVRHVIFNNPSSGYTVISASRIYTDKEKEEEAAKQLEDLIKKKNSKKYSYNLDRFTACGIMVDIRDGDEVELYGYWETNKYGRQIHITQYYKKQTQLTSLQALEGYLSSGLIKGVGRCLVHSIITEFGDKTVDIIENNPEELVKIRGISEKKASNIHEAWINNTKVNAVLTELQKLGFSSSYSLKVYNYFTEKGERVKNIVNIIKDNPYCLTSIQGIGFKTADGIARNIGITNNDERRIQAGIEYTLYRISDYGDVYCTEPELILKTNQMLNIQKDLIKPQIEKMKQDSNGYGTSKLVQDDDRIYLRYFYLAETEVVRNLDRILSCSVEIYNPDIKRIENVVKISYDQTQKDAIITALSSKVMILTGGPGTGKTTTIKGIIEACEENSLTVVLSAPTGRASKRMSEVTGKSACTIHRLLEYQYTETGWLFGRDSNKPIEGDVLIIDEVSMVDISLMYYLLRAIPDNMRLILVGDIDQLPSVGPGNVLRDMIDSKTIPTIQLVNIFRQAQTSKIITNAHLVNKGQLPDISNPDGTDFFFIERDMLNDPDEAAKSLAELFIKVPEEFGVSQEDVQILTPMKKGPLGTIWLNNIIQSMLPNRKKPFIKYGDYYFRVGDRVMQIKNDYATGIYNGDLGIIHNIDFENKGLTVDFSGLQVDYANVDLDKIITAYACTIHKIVIIPITPGHKIMLQRNLIYTAITRAKKYCILVGDKDALEYAVSNNIVVHRNTWLKQRLCTKLS